MFEVEFYQDKNGKEPVREFLISLKEKSGTSKENRILFHKVLAYVRILQEYGTRAGEPYIKHLGDGIWELRPLSERILFFAHINGKFVLLHHFRKRTRKTPKRELECAQKRMLDYTKREGENHGDEFQ